MNPTEDQIHDLVKILIWHNCNHMPTPCEHSTCLMLPFCEDIYKKGQVVDGNWNFSRKLRKDNLKKILSEIPKPLIRSALLSFKEKGKLDI